MGEARDEDPVDDEGAGGKAGKRPEQKPGCLAAGLRRLGMILVVLGFIYVPIAVLTVLRLRREGEDPMQIVGAAISPVCCWFVGGGLIFAGVLVAGAGAPKQGATG